MRYFLGETDPCEENNARRVYLAVIILIYRWSFTGLLKNTCPRPRNSCEWETVLFAKHYKLSDYRLTDLDEINLK